MRNKNSSDHPARENILSEWFLHSAGALLLVFALLIGWYNISNRSLVPPHELLTGFSLRAVYWLLAGICLAVTAACLSVRSCPPRLLLVVWLAVIFEIYQGGLWFMGSHAMRACFSSFSAIYGVPRLITEVLVQAVFIYFLAGGVCLALWSRVGAKESVPPTSSSETLKAACPACGGHIQFAATNQGQTIACPHCQKAVVLRQSQNLKMSCFFCKEHIEFPAHAMGTKMACPHCKMDITLKGPA